MKPSRILLLGLGSIGKRYARLLGQLGCQVLAFDPLAKETPASVTRLENLDLQKDLSSDVDAVFICTPNHLHAEQVLWCLDKGIPFFLEKPAAQSVKELLPLLDHPNLPRIKHHVSCNFRYETGLTLVKRLLSEEKLGKICSITSEFGQYLPDWRPHLDYRNTYSAQKSMGGGILLDRIHEFDYLIALFGQPQKLKGIFGKRGSLDIDVEDTADIFWEVDSGAQVALHLDYLQSGYTCRMKIISNLGVLEWQFKPSKVQWKPHHSAVEVLYENLTPDVDQMYLDQIKDFLALLNSSDSYACSFPNTLAQAYLSLKSIEYVKAQD